LRLEPLEDRCVLSGNVVVRWNELLLEAAQSAPPSRVPVFRNLALESVAVYDAVNAIDRSYAPYFADVHASRGASEEAATAQAAHDTLVILYPQKQAAFDAELAADLAGIPPGRAEQGIAIGREVARQILALRSNDGAGTVRPYTPPNQLAGQWQPTAPDFTAATTYHIPLMTPFVVPSSSLFRPDPPPDPASADYARDFNEVKALGSLNSTVRTPDQTLVAFLWRLPLTNFQVWNRVAQDMATARGTTLEQTARLFALLDMTQSDGLETSFEAKYQYALWRPITAIRDPRSDLINPATQSDPTWTTLHPTTPAFPTYPSNAGAEGSTSATILGAFFGTDSIPFQVHWDAYGFPGVTRSYAGFWDAATEEGRSRVYGGIHFSFDVTAGWELGREVGDYAFTHVLLPRSQPSSLTGGAEAAGGPRAEDGLGVTALAPSGAPGGLPGRPDLDTGGSAQALAAALAQPATGTLTLIASGPNALPAGAAGTAPGSGRIEIGQPSQTVPQPPGAAGKLVRGQPADHYFATLEANPLLDGLGDELSWGRIA
jgi:hypothetical protein